MTKLNGAIKPETNRHTINDSNKAQQHLNKLAAMIEKNRAAEPDITTRLKRIVREVEV